MRVTCLALGLAALPVLASERALAKSLSATNHLPTVSVEVVGGNTVLVNEAEQGLFHEVVVRVTVDDADGDPVSAKLALAPPGMTMRPIVNEPPPVVREIRWLPRVGTRGRHRIVVAAHDVVATSAIVDGEQDLDVVGLAQYQTEAATRLFDVDGDGTPEVVVADPKYDVKAKADAGALVVYDLKQVPGPKGFTPQILKSSSAAASAQLGRAGVGQGVAQVDVTGDGRLDLVAASNENGGKLHVWYGGGSSASPRSDDAQLVTLTPCGLGSGPWNGPGQWLLFHDVTGDGIEDVVVAAPDDSAVVSHGGAIHVWAGGAAITGSVLPTATLRLQNAQPFDALGAGVGPCVLFHDVDGDGIDDVVVAAPFATVAGRAQAGAVAAWRGGTTLAGTPVPLATLLPPTATVGAHLGGGQRAPGVQFGDVDGDGHDDLVVPATGAGSQSDGRVYVWKGGGALAGSPAPLAELRANLNLDAFLTYSDSGSGLHVVDFNGDGVADVIASTPLATIGGLAGAGAAFLWSGGTSFSGTRTPDATFGDTLAQKSGDFANHSRLADLDGDGIDDLLVIAPFMDDGDREDVGLLAWWKGGVARSGSVAPTATFRVVGAAEDDELGASGVRVVDVTGDGVLDVVVPDANADVAPLRDSPIVDSGAVHVFAGAPSLAGSVAPRAVLRRSDATSNERLGTDLVCEDVTGDGVADVVSSAPGVSVLFGTTQGEILVWSGGSSLVGKPAPHAEFFGRASSESLGADGSTTCRDVTGDGVLDLLIASPLATNRWYSAGAAYVVEGGTALQGVVSPRHVLLRASAQAGDEIGAAVVSSVFQIADFDRNGVDDWLLPSPDLRVGSSPLVGGLLWYPDAAPTNTGFGVETDSPQVDALHYFGY